MSAPKATSQVVTTIDEALTGSPTAATAGTGTITTDGGQQFAWGTGNPPMHRVYLANHPNSPANLLVGINRASAGPSDWDVAVAPGQTLRMPEALAVTQLAIYADAAVTYNTNFTVKGW